MINRASEKFCWAWCAVCYWKGPGVKFHGTAKRHAEAHNYQGRHRA